MYTYILVVNNNTNYNNTLLRFGLIETNVLGLVIAL